jgi:hypothetical protein
MGVTESHTEPSISKAAIVTGPRGLPRDCDTVTRHLDRSLWPLQELLDMLPGAERLCLETPFAVHSSMPPVLCASGRLYGSGIRIARYTRVVLELMAWSGGATELRLRPVTRNIANWSERRQRRYFDVAHDTMDELVRLLDRTAARNEVVLHPTVSGRVSPEAASEDHPREDRAAS